MFVLKAETLPFIFTTCAGLTAADRLSCGTEMEGKTIKNLPTCQVQIVMFLFQRLQPADKNKDMNVS